MLEVEVPWVKLEERCETTNVITEMPQKTERFDTETIYSLCQHTSYCSLLFFISTKLFVNNPLRLIILYCIVYSIPFHSYSYSFQYFFQTGISIDLINAIRSFWVFTDHLTCLFVTYVEYMLEEQIDQIETSHG